MSDPNSPGIDPGGDEEESAEEILAVLGAALNNDPAMEAELRNGNPDAPEIPLSAAPLPGMPATTPTPAAPPIPGQQVPPGAPDPAAAAERYAVSRMRHQLAQAEQQRDLAFASVEAIQRGFASQQRIAAEQGQQPVLPEVDPDLEMVDPVLMKAMKHAAQDAQSRTLQAIQPLIQTAEQQQAQQQWAQQQAAEQANLRNYISAFTVEEQQYASTPEGAGYYDRVAGYEQATRAALSTLPIPPEEVERLTHESTLGLVAIAQRLGLPPALVVDRMAQATIQGYQMPVQQQVAPVGGQQQVAPVTGQQLIAPQFRSPVPVYQQPVYQPSQNVQMAQAANAAGVTTRANGQTAVDPSSPSFLVERIKAGAGIDPKTLEGFAAGGDFFRNIARLAEAAEAME